MESINIYFQYLKTNIEGYQYLFLLENFLRGKIDEILTEKLGKNYFSLNTFYYIDNRNYRIDIYEKAFKRYERSIKIKSIIPSNEKIINYIDFKDISVIFKEKWNILKEFFPSGWDINHIESKLSSLEHIRNKIAHNRLLREIELQEIKVVFDYFLRNFENKTLERYLSQEIKESKNEEKNELIMILLEIQKKLKSVSKLNLNIDLILRKIKIVLSGKNNYVPSIENDVRLLLDDLEDYDNKPRIVGKRDELKLFIREKKLVERLNSLINLFE